MKPSTAEVSTVKAKALHKRESDYILLWILLIYIFRGFVNIGMDGKEDAKES